MSSPTKILRITDVCKVTGLSRSTVYALIQQRRFPPQIRLSARAAGWVLEEVEAWVSARIAESRAHGGAICAVQSA